MGKSDHTVALIRILKMDKYTTTLYGCPLYARNADIIKNNSTDQRLLQVSSYFCIFTFFLYSGFDFVFVAFFMFPPSWSAALHMRKDPSLFSGFYKNRIWPMRGRVFALQLTVFSASISCPVSPRGRILLNKCARIYGCEHSDTGGALIRLGLRTSAWRWGFKTTTQWTV